MKSSQGFQKDSFGPQMPKTKCLVFAFLLFFPFFSHANSQFSYTTIDELIIHDYGTEILITLPGNVSNGEGCSISSQLVLRTSHPLFDQMYAALLSAFHSGTTFNGWVNGCHSWGMPVLTRLNLKR